MTAALEKKTMNFREGDWEALDRIYGPEGLSVSLVIRVLVSNHVDKKLKDLPAQDLTKLKGMEL